MEVKFYPKTVGYRNAQSAEIIFKGNTLGKQRSTFDRFSKEGEKVPIFMGETVRENSIALKMAQKLVLEKDAQVLLVCKSYIFKEVIKNSRTNMKAHLRYDEQEKMLIYYVTIVDEWPILLIAYEEWE